MLTVLSVAYPLALVGSAAVGGAEQVLATLDRELTRAGFHSVVVASEGSDVLGTLIATPACTGPYDEGALALAAAAHRETIERALDTYPVDVVHLHGVDFYRYLPTGDVGTLATLHLPPAWYPPSVFSIQRPNTFLNCVSRAQRSECPPVHMDLATIENGIPVERIPVGCGSRDYALSLGRICPEKGYHIAMDAARHARSRFVLAGAVFPYPVHQGYFRDEIAPRLDRERCFVGAACEERKWNLLSGARCLLVPSLVHETSSLVAMEALACGTPVVAFPNGALSDIVDHGVTGYLVNDMSEMADALDACSQLDSEACRDAAVTRFSAAAMSARYMDAYHRIAMGGALS